MSVLNQINEILSELSRNERKVADYILQNPHDPQRFPAEKIAEICGVSRSAVVRFCHKLGYPGYTELKKELSHLSKDQTHTWTGQSSMDVYMHCLEEIRNNSNLPEINKAADYLVKASRAVAFGSLHSGLSAKQLGFRLVRSGIDCHPVTDDSIFENFTNILKQGDVVVIISLRGNPNYIDIAKAYRRNLVNVILITVTPDTPLRRHVDCTITVPSAISTSNNLLLDDAVCLFLMIEVLIEKINKIIKERNEI